MRLRHAALLRGVNVGGKNKLPMKELAEIFAGAGCSDVSTYIQSGNVLFTATPRIAEAARERVSTEIEKRFGHRPPLVVRTADEIADALVNNPYLAEGAALDTLHVMFLADSPDARRVELLDAKRSPPDSFRVRGREIFLCLPGGVADTKLTNAYFDSKLATVSTARNWRTVTKLFELLQN